MKIAFVGKGGSGKTTLSALFCRFLASLQVPVLAIDADINQHLGNALGVPEDELTRMPALGLEMERIKAFLRGSNPRIANVSAMTKTTPPGRGSRLWRVQEDNALLAHFGRQHEGVTLLVTGPFQEQDLGVKCYHSKVGAVELLLNHGIEGPGEYVIVDMTAGADTFASGLFTRFDLTFLVVEPTRQSLGVYRQYTEYARGYDVKLSVIANKIENRDDVAFVRDHVNDDLLTWIGRSAYVRAAEKGTLLPFSSLEESTREALITMKQAVDTTRQDWDRFYRQAVFFHRQNALAWMNASQGEDVTSQIDPDFSPGASLASFSS